MFEIGEQCYFLLSGRVSVLKPVEYKNVKITYEQYFIYLMTLYHNKEFDLIEQLIQINRKCVNIHYLDNLLMFLKAYFIVKLNNDINEAGEISLKFIDKKLKDFYFTYEDYGLKRDEIYYQIHQIKYNSSPTKSKLKGQIKNYLLSVFKPSIDDNFLMNKYNFLFDSKHERELEGFSLFKYEVFICLFPGAFFGETALENRNKKRNASIRTEEECIILSLNNDTYSNLLSDDSKRLKSLDISFICNYFFFINISPVLFDKYYFPFFKALNKKKDDILYQQGDEISSVFLLKEGEIRFEIFCSVLDLYNIIKNYLFTIEKNNSLFKLNDKYIKKLKEQYLNDSFYFNLRNKNEEFKDQLKIKKKIMVYICNTYESFGLIEYFLNSNYDMSCYINSLESKVFEINKYNLEKIIIGEKQIVSTYYQFVCNKLLSQIKRLNNIKEDYIKKIEFKIKEKIYDETINMKYYIRGQVGSYKPYVKQKISKKDLVYPDTYNYNKTSSISPNKLLETNYKKINRKYYTKTELNSMPSINSKANNKNKNIMGTIANKTQANYKLNGLNNIKTIKEEKKIPNIFLGKSKSRLNDIKKNTANKTIVNCGRKFLSLKQIKNKLRYLTKDMYEFEHNNLKTEENTNEVNKVSFYKNDFGLSQSNFRYDLLNTANKFKLTKAINPHISYDSYAGKKNCPNSLSTLPKRSSFWKVKQINNYYDQMHDINSKKKIAESVQVCPINTERSGKNSDINTITTNNNTFLLSQTRDFRDF